jgi:hypothetical protein
MKIISGGQTGVDRAALDAALKHRIECGGWCPAGRLDEGGRIPDRYPLTELAQGSFAERTVANVKDSDATVVIYFNQLQGGTLQTVKNSAESDKPHLTIDAAKISVEEGAKLIADLVREHDVQVLNVAGPRLSGWAGGYDYAFRLLNLFLTRIEAPSPDQGAQQNRRE